VTGTEVVLEKRIVAEWGEVAGIRWSRSKAGTIYSCPYSRKQKLIAATMRS